MVNQKKWNRNLSMWLVTSACAHLKETHRNAGIKTGGRRGSSNADHRDSKTGRRREINKEDHKGHNKEGRRDSNSVVHRTGRRKGTARSVRSRTGRHSKEVHRVRHRTGLRKTGHPNRHRKILIK